MVVDYETHVLKKKSPLENMWMVIRNRGIPSFILVMG
jgi:hypothetical protein